jgi:ubiquitin-conjugating enzyme E2 O
VMNTRLDGMVVVRLGALDTIEDRVYPPDRLHFLMSRGDVLDLVENSTSTSEENSESGDSREEGQPSSKAPLAIWYENDQGERIYPLSSEDDGWSTAGDSTMADDDEIQDVSLMEESVGEAEHDAHFGGAMQVDHLESNEPLRQSVNESLEKDADSGAVVVNNKPEEAENSSSRVPKPRRLSIRGGPASFDVLECEPPPSHAFYGDNAGSLTGSQMRRIHKEHSILSTSLPEGVYVRSWESRLDLFRVLIIGSPDTPYEFAPFLIDFKLPSAFPNNPPDAFFHSWNAGSPINPNLYQDGKICLSLLNT